jgi:hypothetical protein
MEKKYLVYDGFYEDPDLIRSIALSVDYNFSSNYPGKRAEGPSDELYDYAKNKIESILGMKISVWNKFRGAPTTNITSMNGCFQRCFEGTNSWIHHDYMDYAAVVYLSPNITPDAGTGIFRHKETGIDQWIQSDPKTELNRHYSVSCMKDWDCIFEAKNYYNRVVLYPGSMYHCSMISGVGDTIENSRLTQVFFFNIN